MALEVQAPSVQNVLPKDISSLPLSSSVVIDAHHSAKKQTRQWAAWTRQEEESFFNALRQVGKNFEKITCRVQSKNKNQVRHYYYRLVRRINKLLAPGFFLDAKNSKDTIPAMLRWWSLLEKFSCTASKLHLKPRRFKIFIEALEQQLLKDRSKTRRKLSSESCSSAPSNVSVPNKVSESDACLVKQVTINQTSYRIRACKRSLKRTATTNSNFSKEDLLTLKGARQRRRTGIVTSSAYRRWEKAAMVGVSLVADAAEQLEQKGNDGKPFEGATFNSNLCGKKQDRDANTLQCIPSKGACSHHIHETVVPPPSMKLKLQLFPVDESTRKALEKDSHNPHLELTLSSRKRILSVLEHISCKWGSSSIACGELVLLPYTIHRESISSCHMWTMNDTVSCAADVHSAIGSPAIFRLRYGWFSSTELEGHTMDVALKNVSKPRKVDEGLERYVPERGSREVDADGLGAVSDTSKQFVEYSMHHSKSIPPINISAIEPPEIIGGGGLSSNSSRDELLDFSRLDELNLVTREDAVSLAREWADSVISVGDLLSEASMAAHSAHTSLLDGASLPEDDSLMSMRFVHDSFDAVIAAHTNLQSLPNHTIQLPQSSIWNSEETCDGFSSQMVADSKHDDPNPMLVTWSGASIWRTCSGSLGFADYLKDLSLSKPVDEIRHKDQVAMTLAAEELAPVHAENHDAEEEMSLDTNEQVPTEEPLLSDAADHGSPKDPCALDIFWLDSLGPLDLDIPSSRYQDLDLVLGESLSLGSLGRLMASSLDAFQNGMFFGAEKKDD